MDDLITEKKFGAHWQQSATSMISSRSYQLPLTPSISRTLGWGVQMKSLHFTKTNNIMGVVDSQNTRRRHLSTTTDFEKRFLGVLDLGHAILLEGNAVFGSPIDVGSAPDRGGLRWIPVKYLVDKWDDKYDQQLREIYGLYGDGDPDMGRVITDIENWVSDNSQIFKKEDLSINSEYGYNEVILDKYKILEVILNHQFIEDDREGTRLQSVLKSKGIGVRFTQTSDEFHQIIDDLRPQLGV